MRTDLGNSVTPSNITILIRVPEEERKKYSKKKSYIKEHFYSRKKSPPPKHTNPQVKTVYTWYIGGG